MSFEKSIQTARENRDFETVIQSIPYAQLIGLTCIPLGDSLIFKLPPNEDNLGNPSLPAIHGGVIAGFMEMSASLHALLTMDIDKVPKVVNFAIDYLRPGRHQETFAECRVVRQGKKMANVSILAWQDKRETPIATARVHLLMD